MYSLAPHHRLILASGSPRRKDLLTQVGLSFEIAPADIDESVRPGETAENLVKRLAEKKAEAVALQNPEAWVLAADTVVAINGEVLGKPSDAQHARVMLTSLKGSTHSVWGGVTLQNVSEKFSITRVFETVVTMRRFSAKEVEAYVESGEPFGKAGAYAVQGIGGVLVNRLEGSYSNVVGLDTAGVIEMFIDAGILRYGRGTNS